MNRRAFCDFVSLGLSKWMFPVLFLFSISCAKADLKAERLPTAVVGQIYNYGVSVEVEDLWNDYYYTEFNSGDLPDGVDVSSWGRFYGIPTEPGIYYFNLSAFSVVRQNDDDFFFWDDDYYYDYVNARDSEIFMLFVTESSTNVECPVPNDLTGPSTLCLGNIDKSSLAENETAILDINLFFADGLRTTETLTDLTITISYSPDFFEPDLNTFDSQWVREVLDVAGATVDVDVPEDGVLVLNIRAAGNILERSGRTFDIPFVARGNLSPGDYAFEATMVSADNSELAGGAVVLPGQVTVYFEAEQETVEAADSVPEADTI